MQIPFHLVTTMLLSSVLLIDSLHLPESYNLVLMPTPMTSERKAYNVEEAAGHETSKLHSPWAPTWIRAKRVLGLVRKVHPGVNLSSSGEDASINREFLNSYVRGHFGMSRYSFDRPRPLRWG
ncbi:hypothetical protein JTE90_019122 [Oedothorax gibbosus]|uniref:Uncharacterized protein n=1 Tax=Oedothorax gibbosus TaxID=931172 RepID=A0AAV6VAW8_9ARAC|nr:hypothetical protein JTE90_019122 [Oedothorax gibbosus]